MALGSRDAASTTLTARAPNAMKPSTKSFKGPRLASLSSVTSLPRLSVHMVQRFGRRLRPRPLAVPDQFEGTGDLQHAQVVEALARDLQADRQAIAGIAAIDGKRRLVPPGVLHGEAPGCSDMLNGRVKPMCSSGRSGSLVGEGNSAANAGTGDVGEIT